MENDLYNQGEYSVVSEEDNEDWPSSFSFVSIDSDEIRSVVDGSVLVAFTVSNTHLVKNIGCIVLRYLAARPKSSARIWLRFMFHRCSSKIMKMVEWGLAENEEKKNLE